MADFSMTDRVAGMLLAACALTGLAALMIWITVAEWRHLAASRNWYATMGRVRTSRVTFEGHQGPKTARPAITYDYQLGEDVFEGFVVNFGSESYIRPSQAEAVVRRHPVGSTVQVWYDPDNPSDSVLYRRCRTVKLWLISGALTLFAATLWKDALPLVMP